MNDQPGKPEESKLLDIEKGGLMGELMKFKGMTIHTFETLIGFINGIPKGVTTREYTINPWFTVEDAMEKSAKRDGAQPKEAWKYEDKILIKCEEPPKKEEEDVKDS